MTDWDHKRMDDMRKQTVENRKRVIEWRKREGLYIPEWAKEAGA